jgi:hypothetical protein
MLVTIVPSAAGGDRLDATGEISLSWLEAEVREERTGITLNWLNLDSNSDVLPERIVWNPIFKLRALRC